MHIYHIFAVLIKTKEFKNMFTQFKKICMHIAYMDRHIGIVLKNILVAYGLSVLVMHG